MIELNVPRKLYPVLKEAANKKGVSIKRLIIETLIAHFLEQSK